MSASLGRDIVDKILRLSSKHGILDVLSDGPGAVSLRYGSLGALLRRNLIEEWWLWSVTKQENIFAEEVSRLSSRTSTEHDSQSETSQSNTCDESGIRQSSSVGFCHMADMVRGTEPFGVARQVTCYTNLTDKQGDVFWLNSDHHTSFSGRPLKQTSLSLCYFTTAALGNQTFDYWQRSRLKWWKRYSASPAQFSLVNVESSGSDIQQVDIQYQFPWGPVSLETITNRGDCLLNPIKTLDIETNTQFEHDKRRELSVQIETNTVLEQCFQLYLIDGFQEKTHPQSTNIYQVLRLHPKLAPFKVAVATTGVNTSEMHSLSDHIARELRISGVSVLHWKYTSTNINEQLKSYDEKGIPYTILVSEVSLGDGCVKVRARDTTVQEHVHISQVTKKILNNIKRHF